MLWGLCTRAPPSVLPALVMVCPHSLQGMYEAVAFPREGGVVQGPAVRTVRHRQDDRHQGQFLQSVSNFYSCFILVYHGVL